jgi:chromosome segregation ATPase
LTDELIERNSHCRKLESDIAQLEGKVCEQNESIRVISDQNSALENEVSSSRESIKKLLQDQDNQQQADEQLKAELEKWGKDVKKLEIRSGKIKSKNESLGREQEENRKLIQEISEQKRQQEIEKEKSERNLLESKAQVDRLLDQVTFIKEESAKKDAYNKQLELDIETKKRELEVTKRELSSVNARAREDEDKYIEQKRELELRKAEATASQKQMLLNEKKMEALQIDINKIEESATRKSTYEVMSLNEKIKTLETEKHSLEIKLKDTTHKYLMYEERENTIALDTRKIKYRIDEVEFELETKNKLIETLKSHLESKDKECTEANEKLRERNDTQEKKYSTALDRIQELEQHISQGQADFREIELDLDKYRTDCLVSETKIREYNELRSELEKTQQQFDNCLLEKKQLMRECNSMKDKLLGMEEQNKFMQVRDELQ